MVPTITSVSPAEGHSGGKTLVEVTGTGFQLPAAPSATGLTVAPPPSVRVSFGGRVATDVEVWSASRLYCLTPDNDERLQSVTWSALDFGTDTFTANAHGLSNGAVVRLVATVGALPAPLRPEAAYYVVGATPTTFQLSTALAGPVLDIVGAGAGKLVTIGAYDVVVENIDAAGVLIPGETATAAFAFTFRRPDLGQEGELARVMRALIRMLKRQVLENVAFTTHTDFDAATGDTLNLAYVQRLPAIVLANVETPDDPEYVINYDEDIQVGADRFVERRAPAVVMVKLDLIGVTDDPIEMLNLAQAVRVFFRKNPYLFLDRDPADLARGQVQYDLEYTFAGPASVTHAGENSNVESVAVEVRVRGVLLEDMPGITTAKVPGMPAGLPHEATRRFGYTTTDDESAVEATVEVDLPDVEAPVEVVSTPWDPWMLVGDFGSDLTLLLHPTAANVTSSGGLISQVLDLSPLAHHLGAAGALRPLHVGVDQDLNNNPCIRLTGTQYLESAAWVSQPQPRTVVMVVCCDDLTTTGWWVGGVADAGAVSRFGGDNYYAGPGGLLNSTYGSLQGGHASCRDGVITLAQDVHIIEVFFNGASSQFYVDGVLKATGNAGSAAVVGMRLGARSDGTLFINGRMAFCMTVKRALTTLERSALVANLAAKYIPPTVMHYGDSITAGNGVAAGQQIPALLRSGGLITVPYRSRNFGVPSAYAGGNPVGLFDAAANAANVVRRLKHPLAPKTIAFWWFGVNDIYGSAAVSPRSVAAVKADLDAFATGNAAVGIATVALTTMATAGSPTQNALRLGLGASIRNNVSAAPYTTFDVASLPQALDYTNPAMFYDGLHPTAALDAIIAAAQVPSLNAALAA